jgi:Tat protein secretion system quality control protein TatD with DNase activity
MRLVDSHCHLNADRFDGDAELVLGGARLAGVERILVPGWNVASSQRALALADRFDWIDLGVGVHPHDAARVDDAGWATTVSSARSRTSWRTCAGTWRLPSTPASRRSFIADRRSADATPRTHW